MSAPSTARQPSGRDRRRAPSTARRTGPVLILLAGLVVVAALCSIAFGARVVGLEEILHGLTGSGGDLGAAAVAERLPRTAAALAAGAALAVSGALMQAVTRNPIADPGILGINTGSSLAIVASIAFLHISSTFEYLWISMLGAGVTAVFVYAVGSTGPGGATPVKLALAGVATSAAMSSLISAIMLPRAQGLNDFRVWQVGSVGRGTWESWRWATRWRPGWASTSCARACWPPRPASSPARQRRRWSARSASSGSWSPTRCACSSAPTTGGCWCCPPSAGRRC